MSTVVNIFITLIIAVSILRMAQAELAIWRLKKSFKQFTEANNSCQSSSNFTDSNEYLIAFTRNMLDFFEGALSPGWIVILWGIGIGIVFWG